VIWVKGVSTYTPDYFVERLPTSPWIHQPFEEYDNLRPDRLAQEVRRLTHKKKGAGVPPLSLQSLGAQEEDSNLHGVTR
jgi:hypothetical protein